MSIESYAKQVFQLQNTSTDKTNGNRVLIISIEAQHRPVYDANVIGSDVTLETSLDEVVLPVTGELIS